LSLRALELNVQKAGPMNHGLDNTKQPSPSYRGTFRRHRKLFCLPVVLGALAAVFFLFGLAKSYTSTASLWIDSDAPAPSSIGANTGSPLTQPPSAAVQAILNELLMTRAFASSVAETSLLGKSLGSPAAIQANAADKLGAGQVVQSVPGSQILTVSYSASSPAMAESVLRAVVTQLRSYTARLTAQHDQGAVAYDTQQAKGAETALATARNSVSAYLAQHPGATQSDPNYASLVQAENNAATQLAAANTTLSQVGGTTNANGWAIHLIDQPSPATTAAQGKSKMAEVILGGALGGVLVSFLAVVILTPAKKKEAWEDELPTKSPLGQDVPPDPFRAKSPGPPAASTHPTSGTTPFGRRRLYQRDRQLLRPSGPTEEQ
jgi:uncharacterized protein involved in exopolysaccharide biosynthesis